MNQLDFYRGLATPASTRVLLYVIDGLGGLPGNARGQTELEAANTPAMDALAAQADLGTITPVMPGVTPGSGPAHLALFGYDPVETAVGRGVLAALGIGFALQVGDVAARINFCTLDEQGNVVDRRAGRIATPDALPLVESLDGIELEPGIECHVRHVKEYRACVVLRGAGLDGRIADTDPQRTGVPPLEPESLDGAAARTAALAARFAALARERLAGQSPANGVLLRGFDGFRPLPSLGEVWQVRAAAVAQYPMYRGVARLAGMDVLEVGDGVEALIEAVAAAREHDFVYMHYKTTDSRGEDGDFDGKVAEIEQADRVLEACRSGGFDVIAVTGDHSTPATFGAHTWHPVPLMLWSRWTRSAGDAPGFGERSCAHGVLGDMRSMDLLPLALAHAGRIAKFGA